MSAKSHEKFIEEIGNMSVIELADLVKALEAKFNISAAMPMAAAAPVAAAAATETVAEKNEFKVILEDSGAEKIKVIKALREIIPNLALSDAKKMSEETPTVIAEAASKADADKMKKKLEEVGAKVKLA
jgi:large subunit ribosomal protein L7/L12